MVSLDWPKRLRKIEKSLFREVVHPLGDPGTGVVAGRGSMSWSGGWELGVRLMLGIRVTC